MDYEKKIREYLNSSEVDQLYKSMLINLFPELAESERIRKALIHLVNKSQEQGGYALHKDEADNMLAWLEKQGEKNVQYHDICEKCVRQPTCQSDCFLREKEQKPAEEVKLKFKVGDFIINDYCIGKVVELTNDAYLLDTGQGIPFSCENNARLWTIEEAKPGDVLVASDDSIFIYNGEITPSGSANFYVACTPDSHIVKLGDNECGWEEKNSCKPSTKEQRDTLMKEMADAGYTFDFDKKELKKIENEIEIPFGAKDSELQEVTYYIPKGFHAEIDDDKVVIKKGEKPTAWSEEDDYTLNETIQHLEELIRIDKAKHCSVDVQYYQRDIDWLKSLKPQNRWKPSDEQIQALWSATEKYLESNDENVRKLRGEVLESLYEDLKKLKG